MGFVPQALLLMGLWLLLSGHYDVFHIALGVLSVGIVFWLNRKIRRLPIAAVASQPDAHLRPLRLLAYCVWLPVQILKSALYVAYVVLHPHLPISPVVVRFRSQQPNLFAQMILGNSITLTPGTLTVHIQGDEFVVHALTRSTAQDLLDGSMQTKVARLFVDDPGPMVFDAVIDDRCKVA
jgi:multicomponent Na+:H+ antiporter subunit E